jgi:hypothetical protein
MKMPGPNGVITVGSSIEHAFDCDVECVEHAEALALDEALVANLEKMVNEDLGSTTKHAGRFEAAEQTKEVPLVVWTYLGPLPRWVPGPPTRWAPGTTRLALHGT